MTRAQKGQRAKQRRNSRVPGIFLNPAHATEIPVHVSDVETLLVPIEPMPLSWLRRLWNALKNQLRLA